MVSTTVAWLAGTVALLSVAINVWLVCLRRQQRRHRVRAHRESDSMLQSIVAHVPNFIIRIDRLGTILFLNRTVPDLTPEKVIGSTVFDFVPPDEHQRLRAIIARVFETGTAELYAMRGRGAGGTWAWYETHVGPVSRDGQIAGLLLVSNDITARKQMVDALRESEEQFRMLAETVPTAVAIYQDRRQQYCNAAMESITGYSREEITGRKIGSLVHPEDRKMVIARSLARQRGDAVPNRYEFRIVTKQGEQRFVDFAAARIEYRGRPAILGTGLDITKRREAEQTLLQSERYLKFQRDVLQEIAGGKELVHVLDTLCRLVEQTVPHTLCSILFLDEAASCLRFGIGPSFPPAVVRVVDGMQIGEQAGSCGTAAYTKQPAIVSDTRTDPRWHGKHALAEELGIHACWSVPILSDTRDVLGTFAISHSECASPTRFQMDILETASHMAGIAMMRQQSEERQRRSEQRYRLLLEHASDAFFLHDMDGRIVEVNEQACRTLGYSREQMLTMHLSRIDPGWSSGEIASSVGRMEDGVTITLDSTHMRSDGSIFPVELRLSIVQLDEDRLVLMLARDVTERKRVAETVRQQEAQLAHAARLATLGEMVAGIAHEISQPLSAIGNFSAASTSMLESDAADRTARAIQFHRRIREQAQRAGSIIEHLRNFARRTDPRRTVCPLRELIVESVALLDSEARRCGVTVHLGPISAKLQVKVDAIQIQQVVVNLLRNAFEAMNDIDRARRHVWISAEFDGQQVEVAITDSGPGVPPDRRHQVFEAFYTSKENGMGMGLAVSRSIVDAHGGRFWIDDPHDQGAAFHFTIPRLSASRT